MLIDVLQLLYMLKGIKCIEKVFFFKWLVNFIIYPCFPSKNRNKVKNFAKYSGIQHANKARSQRLTFVIYLQPLFLSLLKFNLV